MPPIKRTFNTLFIMLVFHLLTPTDFLHANTLDQSTYTSTDSKQTLLLDDIEARFDISGSEYSTSFFIPSSNANIVDYAKLKDTLSVTSSATNRPNFLQSSRYWIAIDVVNQTSQEDWRIHISNFFLHNVKLYSSDGVSEEFLVSNLSEGPGPVSINPIGRSFPLNLKKNTVYTLVLEINAKSKVRTPYIGIMAKSHYLSWATKMECFYKIAIGIIFGLVIVSFAGFLLFFEKVFIWFGISSLLLLTFNLQLGSVPFELFGWSYEFSPWLWVQASLTILSLLLFAFEFLKITPESKSLYYSFILLIVFSVITLCVSFFISSNINIILFSLNASLMVLLMLGAGFYRLIKKGGYYLIYVLGWTPVLSSLLEYIALIFISGNNPNNVEVSYKAIRELYILIVHILIHSLAIFAQIKALQKQKHLAELTSQAKSWFMAASSHDLRQPLHAMGMHLSLLKEHITKPSALELIDSLENSHAEMNASFKAIMDLSQMEAGAIKVNRKVFFLNELLNKLSVEFSPVAEDKKLSFRKVSTSVYVESDPLLLERVLSNLISNAIRYTVEGKVIIGIRRRGTAVAIQVLDSGCGIDGQELSAIFEIYKRSENSQKNSEGMGIGLSIVKHLSDLLDHKIKVVSAVGKGTMFELQVPVAEGENFSAQQENAGGKEPQFTVALVTPDDSIDKAVTDLLTRWGHKAIRYSSINELHSLSIETFSTANLLVVDATFIRSRSDLEQVKELVFSNNRCVLAALLGGPPEREEMLNLIQENDIELLYNPSWPSQLRALLSYCRQGYTSKQSNSLPS